ncbi:MAG: hypothetical protein V9E88_14105 [Ferruginibacter sp.]
MSIGRKKSKQAIRNFNNASIVRYDKTFLLFKLGNIDVFDYINDVVENDIDADNH